MAAVAKMMPSYEDLSYGELLDLISHLSLLAGKKSAKTKARKETEEGTESFEHVDWKESGPRPKMPAGTYYIGDLCYVFKDEDESYNEIIKMTGWGVQDYIKKGKHILAWFNTGDDGCYEDTKGRRYGVDAGNISIVPVDLIARECKKHIGTTVTFKNEFEAFYVEKGPEEYIQVEEPGNPENCFNIYIRGGPNSDDDDSDGDWDD